MAESLAKQIIKAFADGKSARSGFDEVVKSSARYFRPTYETLNKDQTEGEVALPNTSCGILSHQRFVAGLYSNTVGMGRGVLESANPKLRENEDVKRFLGALGARTNDVVMEVFPPKYREMLDDYALTSAGVVFVHFDTDTKESNFYIYSPSDCVWYQDSHGKTNKLFRKFEYTASQAVEEFGGGNLSEKIRKAADNEARSNDKFEFIHCVRPRTKRNKNRRDMQNMEYESIYVEVAEAAIVEEGGYKRFRYVVPVMFKRRGMITGYSPAMNSLPSMRTIVRATDDFLDAVEFSVRPALLLPDRDAVDDIDLVPGAVNYANLSNGNPFLYGGQTNPQVVAQLTEELKTEVRELHFLDLLQALEDFKTGSRTAYEVAQIIAEKIHMIAPIVHPLKDHCFAPIFEIVAADLVDADLVDEVTPIELIEDGNIRVKYTSRIDSKMSGLETENLLFAITEILQVETALQGGIYAASKMDLAQICERIFSARNVEPSLYRTMADTEEKFNETQAAIAQQQQAEMAAKAARPIDMQRAGDAGSPMDLITQAQADVAV